MGALQIQLTIQHTHSVQSVASCRQEHHCKSELMPLKSIQLYKHILTANRMLQLESRTLCVHFILFLKYIFRRWNSLTKGNVNIANLINSILWFKTETVFESLKKVENAHFQDSDLKEQKEILLSKSS